jgi:4-amino-4-deoxy-L-arabinose transferase-like glycosyltransferase
MDAQINNQDALRFSWRVIALLIFLATIIWLPRSVGLDRFVTTDEVIWLLRSGNFYYALGQRDFAGTLRNKTPGVVTMWVETIAYLQEFPLYRGLGQGFFEKYAKFEALLESHGVDPHQILTRSRALTVLLNSLVIGLGALFAWRLFGLPATLVGFLLIAFEPYHIAVTRLAHLDGPLSSFLFLSVLAYLAYLYNGRRWLSLLVSATSGGLAVLAKLPGFMIIPTVGLIHIVDFLYSLGNRGETPSAFLRNTLNKLLKPLLLWGLVFAITIIIFLPAFWVSPIKGPVDLFLTPLIFTQRGTSSGLGDEEIANETRPDHTFSVQELEEAVRYPISYLWRATPVTLLGLLAALIGYVRRYGILAHERLRKSLVGLFIFVLVYTVFLSIPEKSSAKYYLPIYPTLDLVAGAGWVAFASWLFRLPFLPRSRFAPAVILIFVLGIQAVSSLSNYPYYFTYFNPLMGGSQRANQVMGLGSGEGLDQAAFYLNQKPNAEKLKVLSWYGIGPFSYFFKGETYLFEVGTNIWTANDITELKEMDYLVIYNNQWRRGTPAGLFPYLSGLEPEHSVWIKGIEYARIYNVHTFPPEKFDTPN